MVVTTGRAAGCVTPTVRATLPPPIRLATDVVVVAVCVRAISRIATRHGCGAGGACLSTDGECAVGSRVPSCWRELRVLLGLWLVGGRRVRSRAMAVVVAGLAIG